MLHVSVLKTIHRNAVDRAVLRYAVLLCASASDTLNSLSLFSWLSKQTVFSQDPLLLRSKSQTLFDGYVQ